CRICMACPATQSAVLHSAAKPPIEIPIAGIRSAPARMRRAVVFRSTGHLRTNVRLVKVAAPQERCTDRSLARKAFGRPCPKPTRALRPATVWFGGRSTQPCLGTSTNPASLKSNSRSEAAVPLEAAVFPKTAMPTADVVQPVDRLDAGDEFRMLVADVALDPQP